MKEVFTAYIVPAWSDQAGQCRIVRALGLHSDARASYAANPKQWLDVGLMSSRGTVVCVSDAVLRKELEDCVPLSAGLVISYSA